VYCAEVAELADARGSGPRTRKGVGVRVPSSAPDIENQSSFVPQKISRYPLAVPAAPVTVPGVPRLYTLYGN